MGLISRVCGNNEGKKKTHLNFSLPALYQYSFYYLCNFPTCKLYSNL